MGIPVKIHWSFLLVVLYIAWAFASFSQRIFGMDYGFGRIEPVSFRWAYSLIFAIILFICVALHELGHSYIAHKNGIGIKSITLYFFGGVSSIEEIPRNPSLELQMAFAGPAVSGILGIFCVILSQAGSRFQTGDSIIVMLWTLGFVNLMLMVFNLIPAFPMDGGRLLRAWFATRMPYVTATKRAAEVGKMFAIFMFIIGIFYFNFLLLFVAFFVYVGASEEEKSTEINITLEGIRVKDIMSSNVQTVLQDTTLQEITDLMFKEKHRGYPVMEESVLKGIVTLTDVQKVPEPARGTTKVGQIMARTLYVIAPEEEASTAMRMMNELGIRRLPVIDAGKMVGIVSREDLVRAIELRTGQGS